MIRPFFFFVLPILTGSLAAQESQIQGIVLDQNNAPLPGATLLISNTTKGVTTDFDGNFTIMASVGDVLEISYIGFESQLITITNQPFYEIMLLPGNELKEIVLTGVAGRTDLRKISFSVGKVKETVLQQVPGVNAVSTLVGKIAGVNVVQGNGLPGVSPKIRIRGSSSLLGNQDPLIILDGAIIDGHLSDINSEDIESMEILKGSAGASLYGSRAANGVVQIFTKRGSPAIGTSLRIRSELGVSYVPKARRPSINRSHNYKLDETGHFIRGNDGGYVLEEDRIADNPFPVYYDNLSHFFSTNIAHNQSVQILHRSDTTSSHLSFSNLSQGGILNFNHFGFDRQTIRLNHDIQLTDQLKISTSTSIYNSKRAEPNFGYDSPFYTIFSTPPHADLMATNDEDGSPYNWNAQAETGWPGVETNPLYTLDNEIFENRRQRLIGNYRISFEMTDYLEFESAYSVDYGTSDRDFFVDKDWLNTNIPIYDGGYITRDRGKSRKDNIQLTLSFDKNVLADLNIKSKLFFLYDDRKTHDVFAGGTQIGISNLNDLDNVISDSELLSSDKADFVEKSFAGIVDFDYKNRYLSSFLIRRDGNSLFGPAVRQQTFYRISGAWRLSEDFNIPHVHEFKIRASLGTAGLLPPFAAQFETFSVSSGTAEKNTIGNSNLGPFLSKELEIGGNIEIGDRIRFEYSYAEKKTDGQVLPVDIPVETEGYALQWRNAGTLTGYTNEMSLSINWIDHRDVYFDSTFLFESTNQYIEKLFRPVWQIGPRNSFIIQQGNAYGVFLGSKILTSLDELNENQNPNDFRINDDGYVIDSKGLPVFLLDENGNKAQMVIGDINPDFTLGFNSIFRYKSFSVFMLWDWKQGGDVYNQTKQTAFKELLHSEIDQSKKPLEKRKSTDYYSALYNINATNTHFVEDASYLKLRELNVSYQFSKVNVLNKAFSLKLSLIGRHILQIDNYSGYDPEVSVQGDGDEANFFYDQYGYPSYATITGGLELIF
ncbi:MAG: SusC/RagA family TonB-linked outer membrane protein [Flavobacteriaceae bacterium]|nr:SusC/RagA family TonB-linked outer membrane protein [Flavobacteriaceae bacterium]MCY4267104.1 SusC/RagA family TonB-linked outer membrane protein [Flavobacteriaceae bacterium]